MRTSPSFISWVNDYDNWSQLWLVYLRKGTLRNIPKPPLKLHLFRESSLYSLAWHGLFPLWQNKNRGICASDRADKVRTGKFSLSAFCSPYPSSCFCTTLGAACITGSFTTLSVSGTPGSSSHPQRQGAKSTPWTAHFRFAHSVPGKNGQRGSDCLLSGPKWNIFA